MTAPDSFHDELARLQQAPGRDRDRVESVVSHLRSRKDEPWPTWASALEQADVAAALRAHYAKAEEAGMRARLAPDGRFELFVSSRLAEAPPSLFAEWPSLRDFQRLTLESDPLSFELGRFSPAAQALATSPHARWLSSLVFLGTGLDPAAAHALAASKTLSRLTSVSFTWEGLSGEGVAALVRSPVTKSCASVTFDFCMEGGSGQDAAVAALAQPAFATSIRTLSLRGDSLDAGHITALAGYAWLASLISLDLGHMEAENELGDEGAKTLAGCRALSGLRSLGLAGCGLTDDGANALLAAPHLKACRFDLEDNDLSEEVLEQVLARGA